MFIPVEPLKKIFIMLGSECNCNCNYCLQGKKTSNLLPTEINDDIFQFIDNEIKKERKEKLAFVFYGGEPLLYINTIREFLRRFRAKIDYNIITNGKALTKPIVDLLNRYNFNVVISWDGKNSLFTRNYDVVADKKDLLMKIKNLGFSSVINHYSYPKDILKDVENLNTEYRKNHKNDIHYNIDSLYNFCNKTNTVFDINVEMLSKQMNNMFKNLNYTNSNIENDYINRVKELCNFNKDITFYSMCGNGIYVLNMDLQGNLYLCHNDYSKKLGTIYSSTDEYMKKYLEYFNVQKRFEERCYSCKINKFCKGGCMLLSKTNLDEYCKQRNAMFECFYDLYGKLDYIKNIING